MSLSQGAVGERALADGNSQPPDKKPLPRRTIVALKENSPVPERR
nr:hypothetical protein [uncultured Sphingomonas sp.]